MVRKRRARPTGAAPFPNSFEQGFNRDAISRDAIEEYYLPVSSRDVKLVDGLLRGVSNDLADIKDSDGVSLNDWAAMVERVGGV